MQNPREALESVQTAFLRLKGYSWEKAEEKIRAIREDTKKTAQKIARERES